MPPLVIAAGIAAGAALGGAKMQSSAAKKAAKDQQDATDKALGVQQQQNAPYLQLGQQAAGRLASGQAMGKPYTQQFGGPGGSNGFQAFQPQAQGPPPQGPPPGTLSGLGQAPQGQMPMGGSQPGGSYNATGVDIGTQAPPTLDAYSAALQATRPPQGGQGGMVKLQAPDGSVSQVPMAMAEQFMARGAKRIG